MEFRILGPLEVVEEDRAVPLGGGKQRALLALLVLRANEPVTTDRLIEELWDDHPPAAAAKTVQVHVSRLRRALGGSSLVTREHAYELRADPDCIDCRRFERLVSDGRKELAAGRPERAAATIEESLSLWRGPPLADFLDEPFAKVEIRRLNDLRVAALEELIEAKLALGRHTETVPTLKELIDEYPYRERLRGQLMLALYRSERQADALQAYQDARAQLVSEFGIEPGERLRELERAILAQDPALALVEGERPAPQEVADTGPTGAEPAHRRVVGRDGELAEIEAMLTTAGADVRLIAIEGEPGIGKTTLWREGIARACSCGYRVLSCRSALAETRLSFAGLEDLFGSVDEEAFAPLPTPQRHALEVALLREEAGGAPLDPRAIGTGLVSLVSTLAREAPLLLAVDDVHWLDEPTVHALEFALRRVEGVPVIVLPTFRPRTRDTRARDIYTGLLAAVPADRVSRLRLGPLDTSTLYEIVRDQLGDSLTRPLLGTIERASRGNPFYAVELARALVTAGVPAPGETLPVSDDLRELVGERLRRLPEPTRHELVKASALAQPTLVLVDATALAPAVDAGVVSIDSEGRVALAHPLFAEAVYAGASRERRQRVHAELAEAVTGLEARATHLALSTEGPDDHIAAVLDEAADLAYRRGAPEVAAELQGRAAEITPEGDGEARSERRLRAARHHYSAGDGARARALAEEVLAASPAPAVRVQTLHLLAEQRMMMERFADAIPLLEEALAGTGHDTAQAAQLELSLGLVYGGIGDVPRSERHLRRAVELAESAGDTGLLAEALGLRAQFWLVFGKGLDEGACDRALALEDPDRDVPFQLRPSLNVAQAYQSTGRPDRVRELLIPLRNRTVARGEESDLPFVLVQLSAAAALIGDLDLAEAEIRDTLRVATLNGQEFFRAFALVVHGLIGAFRGEAEATLVRAAEALAIAERIGWQSGIHQARWVEALAALSEDDPEAAAAAVDPVIATVEAIGIYEWPMAYAVPDGIEALVATGRVDQAARLTDRLADSGRRFDRPWALALSGRCRALLHTAAGELDRAEAAARQALVEHERLPYPFERARTLLVLGQIQNRRGRRDAARESLEQSVAVFERIGARRWADKPRAEAPLLVSSPAR